MSNFAAHPLTRTRPASASRPRPKPDAADRFSPLAAIVAVAGAGLIAVMLAGGLPHAVGAFMVLAWLLTLAAVKPQVAIMFTLAFLAVMGDFRRLLLRDGPAGNDPVLLVGPVVAIVLLALAYAQGRLNVRSRLSKLILALMVWMAVEIFNPLQGGLMVGVAGALFFLVPLMWYWIGQSWGSAAFTDRLLFRVVVPVAVAASLLGIQQALTGLLPYQDAWAHENFSGPLRMGENLRPFSFFTSTAEYTCYLALACTIPIAAWMAGRFRLSLLVLPLLVFGLFIAGCRGPLVTMLGTVVVLWALRSKSFVTGVLRAATAAALVVGGMAWTLNQAKDLGVTGDTAKLIDHQVGGLTDPTHKSTIGVHGNLILGGVLGGIRNPIGGGLGSTTLAAAKFGDGAGASSESDYGDVFLSTGVVGGFLYLYIIFRVLRMTVTLWRRQALALGLVAMGLLVTGLGRWLLGGAYAQVGLTWFVVGSLQACADRTRTARRAPRERERRADDQRRAAAWT